MNIKYEKHEWIEYWIWKDEWINEYWILDINE